MSHPEASHPEASHPEVLRLSFRNLAQGYRYPESLCLCYPDPALLQGSCQLCLALAKLAKVSVGAEAGYSAGSLRLGDH